MERNGFEYIASLLQDYDPKRAREMQGLWLEYEDGQTAEAKWVREMDKFDCLIQAHKYEQSTYGEKDFAEFQGLLAKIHSSEARKWAEILQQEREAHFMRCQQQLPIIFVTGMFCQSMRYFLLRSIGDSNASKKASAYVSTILNLPYISMNTILHEKAKDKEYRYSKVIHTCIQEHFDIPVSLLVDLLEKEIGNIGKQKQWVLVSGFPKDTDELVEFERKVVALSKVNEGYLLMQKKGPKIKPCYLLAVHR